jgi:integrase
VKRSKWQRPKVKQSKTETPYWYIRYYDTEGVQRKERFGPTATVKRKEAQKAADAFIDSINSERPRKLQFNGTLEEFYEQIYLPERLSETNPVLKATTRGTYLVTIRNHILPYLGDMKLDEIRLADVNAWLNKLAEKGTSKRSRKGYRAVLSNMFILALEHELVTQNPCTYSKVGSAGKTREKRWLEQEDINKLLGALPKELRLMMLLDLQTGLRISELLAIKWDNVDLLEGTFMVVERFCRQTFDSPKTERAKKPYALGRLLPEFQRWRMDHPKDVYVFQSSRKEIPWAYPTVQMKLKQVARKLGLYYEGFGWHAFRRQCVTVATKIFGAEESAKYVGKAGAATVDPYLLFRKDRALEISNAIHEALIPEVKQ